MGTIRVVFDTNVLISALGWNQKPEECLQLALQNQVLGYTSPGIIDELTRVMEYPQFEFTEHETQTFLQIILSEFRLVDPDIDLEIIEDDPDDDKIIECAVAADADYIVSGDTHLLDLKQFRDIDIVPPAEFLERVRE